MTQPIIISPLVLGLRGPIATTTPELLAARDAAVTAAASAKDAAAALGIVPNLFADGRTMRGPHVRPYSLNLVANLASIVSPELRALGFEQGFQNDSIGMALPALLTKDSNAIVTFYVETDVDNAAPASATIYLWTISDFFYSFAIPKVATLSPRVAKYSLTFNVSAGSNFHHFFVGIDTSGSGGGQARITGMQFHCSDRQAVSIAPDDYPAIDERHAQRDEANVRRSLAMKAPRQTDLQTPSFRYNLFATGGQSVAAGQETWPRLSRVPYGGCKMLGTATLPLVGAAGGAGRQYVTLDGDYALHDLVSVALNYDRTVKLTDAQVAALQPSDGAFAETMDIGWVNSCKYHLNQYLLADDPRVFVSINTAVSGEPIESWLKPNGRYYGRLGDAVTKAKAAAGTDTIGVVATLWNGSQFDYFQSNGGSNYKPDQKAALNSLFNDYRGDVSAITGQTKYFANFLFQTTGYYTIDNDNRNVPALSIGMAQLEVSRERSDVFMVGPDYPYTDKLTPQYGSDHPDANGARWAGCQAAKVTHRVVALRQDWEPLAPILWTQEGDSVFGDFHVPEPPVVFDGPYSNSAPVDVAGRGFKVSDANGDVKMDRVQIVGRTQVRIDLMRKTVGQVLVWYAHAAVGGMGMLRDSDPAVSRDFYEYLPNSGMYAAANIPALVGHPYPLWNWCTAFVQPIGRSAT
ncbi:hypothetical protein [Sphingomonas bacterium]|uniref:hypothetical protein n=1 Tax=Sphingomonas bacterium TaxID=1895847 RepID=UPI001575BC94|nr:hypothetical protein [Sphingomonas bacterium]